MNTITLTPVVPAADWDAARLELLAKEKEATRQRDALAAERRLLPRVHIGKDYAFDGPKGRASLLDLFESRHQPTSCSARTMRPAVTAARCSPTRCATSHLHARDTSLVFVSRAPLEKIEAYRSRMGWSVPWFSSFASDFNVDFGVSPAEPQPDRYQDGETFGLSVFIRDGDDVYRTYFTTARGVEYIGTPWSFLDLTPLGRQEDWEDSPEGCPQTSRYRWWRRHDEYEG